MITDLVFESRPVLPLEYAEIQRALPAAAQIHWTRNRPEQRVVSERRIVWIARLGLGVLCRIEIVEASARLDKGAETAVRPGEINDRSNGELARTGAKG